MGNILPFVSIGLPVYNGQNFIKQALEDILMQTYDNFELIISDNASTDNTEAICREYEVKDKRIRYYRNKENLGAAKNYNRVFELSRGKYFAWMNHDDLYDKQFLEKCVEGLEDNPSAILAYPKSFAIDEKGEKIDELFCDHNLDSESPYKRLRRFHDCVWEGPISQNGTKSIGIFIPIYGVIRREVLKNTRLIGSYISSDTTLLEELALLGKFYLVPIPLFYKRHHPQRSMQLHNSFAKRILWFDPSFKKNLLFPKWRIVWEHFRSINNIDLNWKEKLYCFTEILRYIYVERRKIVLELVVNFGQLFSITSFKNKRPFYFD